MDLRDVAIALAAPEPEPFTQTYPTAEDNARWQAWHDDYNAALAIARGLEPRSLADYAHRSVGCIGC